MNSARCASNASAARSSTARALVGRRQVPRRERRRRGRERAARRRRARRSTTEPTIAPRSAGLATGVPRLRASAARRAAAADDRAAVRAPRALRPRRGASSPSARPSARFDARRSSAAPRRRSATAAGCAGAARWRATRRTRPGSRGDLARGQARVDDAVDEGGIGAVLEQPAHEIRQQVLVRAHRRVDAARRALARGVRDDAVELLAHAVQALELEDAAAAPREVEDARHRVRVVGRELRVDHVGRVEHQARAGEVGDVGALLPRVDGVARMAALLGALDLAVPVRTLDEPHVEAPAGGARARDQPADHVRRALLVGLHREAEALPAGERRRREHALDELERELEPLGLLGVHGERDARGAGALGEQHEARRELGVDPLALGELVARMERGELDRDRRRRLRRRVALGARRAADRLDRLRVGLEVAVGVGHRQRRLAEHVEGIAVARVYAVAGALERLVDRAPHDELVAENPHRLAHRGAHHGLADARHEVPDEARGVALGAGVRLHDAARSASGPRSRR